MRISRKLCVVGDFGVGKTSLIRRYVHGLFDESYKATLGVNCYSQTLEMLHPVTSAVVHAKAIIWDIEGGAQKIRLTDTYLTGCHGALLVADLSRPKTLDILLDYDERVRRVSPGCPIIIALNKCDLVDQLDDARSTIAAAEKLSETIAAKLIMTSAATGDRVPEAFADLISSGLST